MMTPEALVELKFLQSLSPTQLLQNINGLVRAHRLQYLEAQYTQEKEAEHKAFIAGICEEQEVVDALKYDYRQAIQDLDKAVFTIPNTIHLKECAAAILRVQSWKDYVFDYLSVLSTHYQAMSSACERAMVNWQSLSLARSEWQAKAESMGKIAYLVKIRDRARRARARANLIHESLTSKWNTLSRISAVLDQVVRIGDVDVPPISILVD
jgi:hypothetical protein